MKKRFMTVLWVLMLCLIAGTALAKYSVESNKVALDTIWVLLAGAFVIFMQPGFAMLEAGFSRAKNACNILMKILMDFSFGSFTLWIIGFGLMFGAGNWFAGTSGFFLSGGPENFDSLSWATVPLEAKYFFQLVFCATAATIVSGAMAERTKFTAYIAYSIITCALIYPLIGALDLGRRMAGRARHVGLCRFNRCPFGGGLAGPGRRYPRRTTYREICRRRNAETDPGTQPSLGRPRGIHPLVRLVRI